MMVRHPQASVLLLYLFAATLQRVSAAGSICSSGIYEIFAPLKANTQVQEFCTSSYPVYITSTFDETTVITVTPAPVSTTLTVTTVATLTPAPVNTTLIVTTVTTLTPAPINITVTVTTVTTVTAAPARRGIKRDAFTLPAITTKRKSSSSSSTKTSSITTSSTTTSSATTSSATTSSATTSSAKTSSAKPSSAKTSSTTTSSTTTSSAKTSSTTTSITTTSSTTKTSTKPANTAEQSLISSLEALIKSDISTFCSCIESPQTKFTTIISVSTSTVIPQTQSTTVTLVSTSTGTPQTQSNTVTLVITSTGTPQTQSTAVTSVSTSTVSPVPVCAAPGVNIVVNGDFETGSQTPWDSDCDGVVVSGGDNSGYSYGFSLSEYNFCALTQTLTVVPGVRYTVTYNYMISETSSSEIDPEVLDSNGKYLGDAIQFTDSVATNAWLSGDSFAFSSTTPTVTLQISFYDEQYFFVDNIVVSC